MERDGRRQAARGVRPPSRLARHRQAGRLGDQQHHHCNTKLRLGPEREDDTQPRRVELRASFFGLCPYVRGSSVR